jgi:SAM-dependent MidA family methyltransferase
MRDALKVVSRFPAMKKAVTLHLVELSQALRSKQYSTLIGSNMPAHEKLTHALLDGIDIHWHSFYAEVPNDVPILLIAQVLTAH